MPSDQAVESVLTGKHPRDLVELAASAVLVPRKSTSMVILTWSQMTRWTQAELCIHCSLRGACHYRVLG
jgi:hypothetical protein